MKQITEEEYKRATDLHDKTTTWAIDKNNNFVNLCATYAEYYMYIKIGKNKGEYYELTLEEFNAKERELTGDTIYRINDIEFKNVQGFYGKPHVFDIVFYGDDIYQQRCTLYFYYNDNGVFARGYDYNCGMTGYFKISDNINQFSTDKIVNRLKKYFPEQNINQMIFNRK
jgi:hypothetical protein